MRRYLYWFLVVIAVIVAHPSRVPAGYKFATLVAFNFTNGGAYPLSGLVGDASGNIFGTTVQGGPLGYGDVFELAAGTHTFSNVVIFNGVNGAGPSGNLVVDGRGNVFGTTLGGYEPANFGTVYSVASGTHALTTLASSFSLADDSNAPGANPIGLAHDPSGNIYGPTYNGGANGHGTFFEVTAGTHAFTSIASFSPLLNPRPLAV